MKKIITTMAGMVLALGLAACNTTEDTDPPATSTIHATTLTSTSSEAVATISTQAATPSSEASSSLQETTPPSEVVQQPVVEESYVDPTPIVEESYVAPQAPPFMRPEDYDPYGPPRFVECWEANAAVMSDGSIVTDTVNCAPEPTPPEVDPYGFPPRADGCVGPAAVCGYYDEFGNPIWFDKLTGETSPRYYDEFGDPTMEAP